MPCYSYAATRPSWTHRLRAPHRHADRRCDRRPALLRRPRRQHARRLRPRRVARRRQPAGQLRDAHLSGARRAGRGERARRHGAVLHGCPRRQRCADRHRRGDHGQRGDRRARAGGGDELREGGQRWCRRACWSPACRRAWCASSPGPRSPGSPTVRCCTRTGAPFARGDARMPAAGGRGGGPAVCARPDPGRCPKRAPKRPERRSCA